MNQVEAIKRGVAPVKAELTNANMPYTVTGFTGSALNVYNSDTVTALVLTLTIKGGTLAITIPASTTWSDNVPLFTAIAASGSTTFICQVKGWNKDDQ